MRPERIAFWKNNKNWTIYQLVFLLKEQEPVSLNELDASTRAEFEQELADLKLFVSDGPRKLAIDEYPLTTPLNSTVLLDWFATLDGYRIPEVFKSLLSPELTEKAHDSPTENQPLHAKQKRSYLLTIAALCEEAGIDLDKPFGSSSNGVIEVRLKEFGAKLCENTIGKIMNEARHMKQNF